jgi:periplasmic protein TonB
VFSPLLGPIMFAILATHAPVLMQAVAAQPPTASAAQQKDETPWPPLGVFRSGGSVTPPRLVKDVKPSYTAAAFRAKIQGTVAMEAVVERDGTVGEIRVTHSLDREFGQDDEAVRSLKQWRFKPGTKDGVPVPVLVEIEMSFTRKRE